MSKIEASGTVQAGRREVFHFTDWCYNDSLYDPNVKEARIVKLPDSDGLGKVTSYSGEMMGCKVEWEGESVAWKENELWAMRANKGLPARLRMETEMRFEESGHNETEVAISIQYEAPYSILGRLLDALFLRREVHRMAINTIEGLKKAAVEGRIPPLVLQAVKREADLHGRAVSLAPTGAHPPGRMVTRQ